MRRFAWLLLLALPLAAQEQKKEEPKPQMVQKLFILKYADPFGIEGTLRVFGAAVVVNRAAHALAVSASSATMPAIEEVIQKLDVPSAGPKDIDLTVYFLVASETENAVGRPLPKDLDTVVVQLKGSFPFKSYGLKDVLNLRTRTGRGAETSSAGGAVQIGQASAPIITQFKVNSTSVGPDGTIRIDGLKSGSRMPVPTAGSGTPTWTYVDIGVNTDLDIKEGQKLVVGRVGISPDQALFLVLTARVAP